MNKFYYIAILFLSPFIVSAQALDCPDNQVIEATEIDSLIDFGEPTVNVPEPYELSLEITPFQEDCDGDFFKKFLKVWTLKYGNETETCQQVISVNFDSFDNYEAPEDIELEDWNLNNVGPEVTGYYGPENFFTGNIISGYEDNVFDLGAGIYKILRTWTLVNWCDASTIEHIQIIRLTGSSGFFDSEVTMGNGVEIKTYDYRVLDVNDNEMDLSACSGSTSLLEVINCLHQANPSETLKLEVTKQDAPLNGVSSLDLVLIQKHILGLTTFSDVWQILAADNNNDQAVSAIDMIEGRKLILGIYSNWPKSNTWNFYNGDIDPNLPSTFPFDLQKDLIFTPQELPLSELSIIGVVTGDVNYSAIPD